MDSINRRSRIAGWIYLLLVFAAPYRLIFLPNMLYVSGDAAATAANLRAHEMLFRLGMAADVFCGVVLIFLVLALYRLFEAVDRNLAVLMVISGGVIPATIDFMNVANDGAALMMAQGADYLGVFEKAQQEAMAMFYFRLHNQVIAAAETLWGLWLLPLGILTWRSGFLPRWIGGWLIINGFAYMIISVAALLRPALGAQLFNLALPAMFGELAFVLWLLIRGAQPKAPKTALSSAA